MLIIIFKNEYKKTNNKLKETIKNISKKDCHGSIALAMAAVDLGEAWTLDLRSFEKRRNNMLVWQKQYPNV